MPFDALSFAGCGTLNFYQTGVAHALQQAGLTDDVLYAGTSAGSGLAVLMASGIEAKKISDTTNELLAPFQGKNLFKHPDILTSFIDSFLDVFMQKETLLKIGERVHISITTLRPFQNQLVNQFTDLDDLCQALRASCHVPSILFPSVSFRGQQCIDGGFTKNSPKIGSSCLRVSPFFFDPRMKINPRRLTPPWWALMIPKPKRTRQLFEQGAKDAERYIQKKEFIALR